MDLSPFANTWTHVAVVYDSSDYTGSWTLYADGKPLGAKIYNFYHPSYTDAFAVTSGGSGDGPQSVLDGTADFGMLARSVKVTGIPEKCIDIVGTGGDGKNTFNISTCACFVVAGAGYKVAKHGNVAATSVSGASNVIEAHGVKFTNDIDILADGANVWKSIAKVQRFFEQTKDFEEKLMISACGRDKLFLDLKDADHR